MASFLEILQILPRWDKKGQTVNSQIKLFSVERWGIETMYVEDFSSR